jgi:hypothetical protein
VPGLVARLAPVVQPEEVVVEAELQAVALPLVAEELLVEAVPLAAEDHRAWYRPQSPQL